MLETPHMRELNRDRAAASAFQSRIGAPSTAEHNPADRLWPRCGVHPDGNGELLLAGLQGEHADTLLPAAESTLLRAAGQQHETLEVAETVIDNFADLACITLRLTSHPLHGHTLQGRFDLGGIAAKTVDPGRHVADVPLEHRVPPVRR